MVNSIYVLQNVPGKGKGLVATEKICKGTRILSEEPIITFCESASREQLQTSISQQVKALSKSQREAFLSMHNIHPFKNDAERYMGICSTISLPAELFGDKGGIFLEACRINHACDNNAQKDWNDHIKRHTVHALRDINKGEEITITYLAPLKSRKVRQEILRAKFRFTCSCRLCSLPIEQSKESDRRLEEIRRLDEVIEQLDINSTLVSPLRTLRYFDQQVHLYIDQEREDVGFAHAFVNAAQLVIANGDLARGRIFAKKAASIWKTTIGSDSTQAIRFEILALDPSKYELFGASTRWTTKIDDVPQGFEPRDFDDWLWRRGKPIVLGGQLANLRNRAIFPGFIDLPNTRNVDPDFYESTGMATCRPRRHWCFLGEMMDFTSIHHLEIELKDIDGTKIPLHFYTETRGTELAPCQLQRGYTVAILYAKRYIFMHGDPGIRHEDPQMIRIFPLSLDKLLVLNDQVQQFSTKLNGIRECHGCGKKAVSLHKCSKCSFFWYCDKACQEAGWKEKGHKTDCKLLRDPDLRAMFTFKWDEFDDYVRFPLPAA